MKIRVLYPCVNCKIKISSHQNLSFVSTQATDDHRTKMKTLQLVNWSTPPKLNNNLLWVPTRISTYLFDEPVDKADTSSSDT